MDGHQASVVSAADDISLSVEGLRKLGLLVGTGLGVGQVSEFLKFRTATLLRELWHSRSGFVYQRRHDLPSGDLLARGRLQTSSDTIDIDKFFPFQKLEECHAIAYNSSLRLRAYYGAYARYSPERPSCIQLRCNC
jgi:hypothetical protein